MVVLYGNAGRRSRRPQGRIESLKTQSDAGNAETCINTCTRYSSEAHGSPHVARHAHGSNVERRRAVRW